MDGTYSVTWPEDELEKLLLDAFVQAGDPAAAQEAKDLAENNAGTLVLVLDAGRYDIIFKDLNDESCPGDFVVDGNRIVMTATSDPSRWDCGDGLGQVAVDATWSLEGGTLTLSEWNVPVQDSMVWFNSLVLGSKPLDRVSS